MVRVWDPLVRIFHWGLVAVFALAWLTSEDGSVWHEWAGYAALGLIAVRLIWGLVGPHYARFTQFIRGPGAVTAYMGDLMHGREKRYLGHNPAGAAMIVALLLSILATGITGWMMAEPGRVALLPQVPAIVAPAFADQGEYGEAGEGFGGEEEALNELHGALANLTLLLVALHIGGVALASMRHRENLARAMITGRKRAAGPGDIA